MSMISGLIDELNKSADEWNGSNMFELARMCREAADTIWQLRDDLQRANAENAKLMETLQRRTEQFEGMTEMWVERGVENAKLREQMERLVTLLRVDCDIDASWDGLRRFWSIGLTENGCLMRDRACKAESENAKLRELVDALRYCAHEAHGICARVPVGWEKPFTCCPLYDFDTKEYRCKKLMRELRVEVTS